MAPAVSWEWEIGTTCVRLTSPTVGLIPTTPLADAGQTTEPLVSVPTASGAYPAATPAAEPELDPHGLRVGSWGLRAWPPTALQPLDEWSERMLAHSLRFVLPRITAPAARSRATRGASRPVSLSARAREPAVVGWSAVSTLSLIRTGMPSSGRRAPRVPCSSLDSASSRSRRRACSSAVGSTVITA